MNQTKNTFQSDTEILSKTETEILPVSYVLWLTIRSRFIDEIAKQNAEILNQWSHFENQEMERIEKETEALNVI